MGQDNVTGPAPEAGEPPQRCAQCDEPLRPGNLFCTQCGHRAEVKATKQPEPGLTIGPGPNIMASRSTVEGDDAQSGAIPTPGGTTWGMPPSQAPQATIDEGARSAEPAGASPSAVGPTSTEERTTAAPPGPAPAAEAPPQAWGNRLPPAAPTVGGAFHPGPSFPGRWEKVQPRRGPAKVAAAGAVLLALDLSLVPAFSFIGSQFFWQLGLLHVDIAGFQAATELHTYPANLWWIAIALAAGLVAVIAAFVMLSSPDQSGAVVLALAGTAAAITSILGTAGVPRGVGAWGALGMGVVVTAAALAVVLGKYPDMATPRLFTPFAAVSQVAFVLIVLGFLIANSTPSNGAPSLPSVPTVTYTAQGVTTTIYPAVSSTPDTSSVTDVPAGPLSNEYTFTESEAGGYNFSGTLMLGSPEKFATGLSENGFEAGTACTINEGTDGVIPGQLVVTNATSDFDAYPGIALTWSDSSISIEADFSSGADCENENSLNVESVRMLLLPTRTLS